MSVQEALQVQCRIMVALYMTVQYSLLMAIQVILSMSVQEAFQVQCRILVTLSMTVQNSLHMAIQVTL